MSLTAQHLKDAAAVTIPRLVPSTREQTHISSLAGIVLSMLNLEPRNLQILDAARSLNGSVTLGKSWKASRCQLPKSGF